MARSQLTVTKSSLKGENGEDVKKNPKNFRPLKISIPNSMPLPLPPLQWDNFQTLPQRMTIANSGYSIILTGKWKIGKRPCAHGGPLSGNYLFSHIHFLWGGSDSETSEYSEDGTKFPLEMHVVHYKDCYSTHEDAVSNDDGIIVLVYFFNLYSEDNPALLPITKSIPNIMEANTVSKITPVSLESLSSTFSNSYFVYWGAINTQIEEKPILWMISRKVLPLSRHQLYLFRGVIGINGQPLFKKNNITIMRKLKDQKVYFVDPSEITVKDQPLKGIFKKLKGKSKKKKKVHFSTSLSMPNLKLTTDELKKQKDKMLFLQSSQNLQSQENNKSGTESSDRYSPAIKTAKPQRNNPCEINDVSIIKPNYNKTSKMANVDYNLISYKEISLQVERTILNEGSDSQKDGNIEKLGNFDNFKDKENKLFHFTQENDKLLMISNNEVDFTLYLNSMAPEKELTINSLNNSTGKHQYPIFGLESGSNNIFRSYLTKTIDNDIEKKVKSHNLNKCSKSEKQFKFDADDCLTRSDSSLVNFYFELKNTRSTELLIPIPTKSKHCISSVVKDNFQNDLSEPLKDPEEKTTAAIRQKELSSEKPVKSHKLQLDEGKLNSDKVLKVELENKDLNKWQENLLQCYRLHDSYKKTQSVTKL